VARGLAALAVAAYHHGFGDALAKASGWAGFEAIAWPGSQIAVPLFFVISGFCIHRGWLIRKTDEGFLRAFFLQRFFRIYPPWVFAVAVSAAVVWLNGTPATGAQWLTHLTLTNGFFDDYRLNAALWSVSVESFLYLIYPLWLAVRRRRGLAVACALALAVNVASCAVTAHFFDRPAGPSLWFFLNVWAGWIAGAVVAEALHRRDLRLLHIPSWWLAGALGWALHLAAKFTGIYTGVLAFAELPLTIVLCMWPLALIIRLGPAFVQNPASLPANAWLGLAQVGQFSYSLYLLHIPLQSLRFPVNAWLTGIPAKTALFVGWFGLILIASWLSYRWIEQPAIRWGRRIVARGSAAAAGTLGPIAP
jgi:peptidoglycan/LPS O-acetylase OafA/YrhL